VELRDVISRRRSVRKFDAERQVSDEDLRTIVEAGRMAPSWKNDQPWRFLVVRSQEQKDRIAECLLDSNPATKAVRTASALILVIGVPAEGTVHQDKQMWLVDCGIAGEHIVLQATDLGIGTVWVSQLDSDRVCSGLELPDDMQCVAIFPLGYALPEIENRPRTGRKEAKEVIFRERYGQPWV
jgi:nitroreductase